MSALERLLVVQEHDTARDRLRHRRQTLPERAELAAREADVEAVTPRLEELRTRRNDVNARETALAREAQSLDDRATGIEKEMYSGKISSPRELQAMQTDVELLRRRRTQLEDQELDLMEQREQLDAEVGQLESEVGALGSDAARLRAEVAERERELDAGLTVETAARDTVAAELPANLVDTYERCRVKARGVGAARLVGLTCQGCHLTIPATEAERIRKQSDGAVGFCDNCGAILVP